MSYFSQHYCMLLHFYIQVNPMKASSKRFHPPKWHGVSTVNYLYFICFISITTGRMMYLLNAFVIPKSDHWKNVALYSLCYDSHMVEEIEQNCASDPKQCYADLFENWLSTGNGISPKTLATLLTQLTNVKNLMMRLMK